MILSVILALATGFELRDQNCISGEEFTEQSFQLAFYPPDASGFSQPVLYGVFNQLTFVDHVVGSWSTNNTDWNDFVQPIDLTYPNTMLVMFAPWIRFSSLPDSNTGAYFGRLQIYGNVSGGNSSELIWCTPFEIPVVN
jgi:hypothetical protein